MPSWRFPTLSSFRSRRRDRRRQHRESDSSGLTLNSSLSDNSLKEDPNLTKRNIFSFGSGTSNGNTPGVSRTSRNLFTAASPFRSHTYASGGGAKPRKLGSSRNHVHHGLKGGYEDSTLFTHLTYEHDEPPTETSLSPFFGNFAGMESMEVPMPMPMEEEMAPRSRTNLTANDVVFF